MRALWRRRRRFVGGYSDSHFTELRQRHELSTHANAAFYRLCFCRAEAMCSCMPEVDATRSTVATVVLWHCRLGHLKLSWRVYARCEWAYCGVPVCCNCFVTVRQQTKTVVITLQHSIRLGVNKTGHAVLHHHTSQPS